MLDMTRLIARRAVLVAPTCLVACLSASTVTSVDGGGTHEGGGSSSMSGDGGGGSDVGTTGDSGRRSGDAGLRVRDGGAGVEAGPVADAGADAPGVSTGPDGAATSRCTMTPTEITCTQKQFTITTPAGSDPEAGTTFPSYARVVHYQVPLGTPPAAGWPTVFMFQGSFVSAGLTFSATSSDAFGMYYQTEVVMSLLDAGFAVLAPEALSGGDTYWQTNIAPYAADWSGSPDDLLVKAMFADVANGTFGPLDPGTLFATGISSGGYMSSRMATSYVGKFKALAIESGAYATCLSGESAVTGGECTVPALSATHPPTLFLHGNLDTVIVPLWTVQAYETALTTAGVVNKYVHDANSGHQWIPEAPAAVLAWFQSYK